MKGESRGLAIILVGVIALYVLGSICLSRLDGVSFEALRVFEGGKSEPLWSFLSLRPLVALAGLGLFLLVPGMAFRYYLFSDEKDEPLTFFSLSMALSLGLLVGGMSLFKIISSQPVSKGVLIGLASSLTLLGIVFKKPAARPPLKSLFPRENLLSTLAVVVMMGLFFGLFHAQTIGSHPVEESVYKYKLGDHYEMFGMAMSLKDHLLPHWDLSEWNAGKKIAGIPIGGIPPLIMYVNFMGFTVLGESYAAFSLLFFGLLLGLYWVLLSLMNLERESPRVHFGLVMPFFLLIWAGFLAFSQLTIYLRGHAPQDETFRGFLVAPENFFLVCLFLSFCFLLQGKERLFLLFAILASLTRYHTFILTYFGLFSYWLVYKKDIKGLVAQYVSFNLIYVLLVLVISIIQGSLRANFTAFWTEQQKFFLSTGFFLPLFTQNSLKFLLWFLYGSAFLGLAFFFPHGEDKVSKYFSLIGIAYLLFILFTRQKRIYYIGPLVFMAQIVGHRFYLRHKEKKSLALIYALACLGGIISFVYVMDFFNQRGDWFLS